MVLATTLVAALPARAATISTPLGDTAAQAPIGTAYSRFATDDVDEALLAALKGGSAATLFATGASLDLRYLGTGAARSATLSFDGESLVDTRSGCDFATALADAFCVIDSIGRTRRIHGLALGTPLAFSLQAHAQPLGDASVQRPVAQTFSSLAAARWVDLGGGRYVLGFEEGADGSFNDMVFLLSGGLTPTAAPVPEPGTVALLSLGALLLAARRRPR